MKKKKYRVKFVSGIGYFPQVGVGPIFSRTWYNIADYHPYKVFSEKYCREPYNLTPLYVQDKDAAERVCMKHFAENNRHVRYFKVRIRS